jgi:hypothetical protein
MLVCSIAWWLKALIIDFLDLCVHVLIKWSFMYLNNGRTNIVLTLIHGIKPCLPVFHLDLCASDMVDLTGFSQEMTVELDSPQFDALDLAPN